MKSFEIEKGLKLCSLGAKEKTAKCKQCPYLEKGCLSALLSDATRYIDYLKSPRHDYNERKRAEAQIPKNGDMSGSSARGSKAQNPEKQGSPAPCRNNGKPVSEWLKEERERREKNGEKDCGDIPW